LKEIRVPGHDHHVQSTLLRAAASQTADHVIGFVSLTLDNRDIKRINQLANADHLQAQLIGHRHTVGLVGFELLMPERPAAFKRHHRIRRMISIQYVQQHRGKTIDRVCDFPFGC